MPNAKIRYIDPSVFTIEFEAYVYDNIVGLIQYESDDIFGIEIHSEKLARQQRTIFDMLWKLAR